MLARELGEHAAVGGVDPRYAGRERVVLLDLGQVGQLCRVAAVGAMPDVHCRDDQTRDREHVEMLNVMKKTQPL